MVKAKEGSGSVVTQKNKREKNLDWNKMLLVISGML